MRYFLVFVLGLVVGTVAAIYGMNWWNAAPADSAVARRDTENVPRTLQPKSPQNPIEQSINSEPSQKPVPEIELPPDLPSGAVVIPVAGARREELRNMFHDRRGGSREHQAIDIMAPRGTPVLAAIDGSVGKLFLSKAGGMTVYQYDPSKAWIYYYAHLDGYAPGLVEGKQLRRGEVIGFVGTSGNAAPDAPHLHFAVEKLTEPGRWWKSQPINPYPLLSSRGVTLGP